METSLPCLYLAHNKTRSRHGLERVMLCTNKPFKARMVHFYLLYKGNAVGPKPEDNLFFELFKQLACRI